MGNKFSRYQKGIISFIYLTIGIFLLNGCTTTPTQQPASEAVEAPVIESRTSSPEPVTSKAAKPADTLTLSGGQETQASQEQEFRPNEPRIFFEPRPLDINQVLGVDFTMVDRGKSRLIVTTDKKVKYRLVRKGPKNLVLTLEESTIPPLLRRRLDSTYFEGAVDRVKASIADKQVALAITLRDIVPYHVRQEADEITIDFGPTAIRPPERRIVPLKFAQAKPQPPTQPQTQAQTQTQPQPQPQAQPQAQPLTQTQGQFQAQAQ
ncbi:MAG: hypothetical protein JRI43_00410, partial [Deltaproteobacteria bacterium]|nr:hypothetical protein [Deltaproteobacteria bacterium]